MSPIVSYSCHRPLHHRVHPVQQLLPDADQIFRSYGLRLDRCRRASKLFSRHWHRCRLVLTVPWIFYSGWSLFRLQFLQRQLLLHPTSTNQFHNIGRHRALVLSFILFYFSFLDFLFNILARVGPAYFVSIFIPLLDFILCFYYLDFVEL